MLCGYVDIIHSNKSNRQKVNLYTADTQSNELQEKCCLALYKEESFIFYNNKKYKIMNACVSDYYEIIRLAKMAQRWEDTHYVQNTERQKRNKSAGKKTGKNHRTNKKSSCGHNGHVKSASIKSSWGCHGYAPTCFMSGGRFTPK